MAMSADERSAAVTEIDQAYSELTKVLDSLTKAAMERPNTIGHWNGKDLLSHIAAWEIEGARHANALDAGMEDSIPETSTFDAWNEEQVTKTRDWTVDQVRAYFEGAHREFMQVVQTSPSLSHGLATGLTSHHYGEHIDQFRRLGGAVE